MKLVCVDMYIYIYIYTFLPGPRRSGRRAASRTSGGTASLRTRILDSGGFDSSRILMLRGGALMSKGNSPEVLSRRILVGIVLVGRLGVHRPGWSKPEHTNHQDMTNENK